MAEETQTLPKPDPTALTTANLARESATLEKLFAGKFEALRDLYDEKFRGVGERFAEKDARSEQSMKDSKIAVDAAFSAAKEAVAEQNKSNSFAIAKSEAATTKQIDQIGTMINGLTAAVNDKIDDVKARVTAMEAHSKGAVDVWPYIMGVFGLVIAAISVTAMLMHR